MRDVSIIGVGNLGGALAIALTKAGWRVEQLVTRNDVIAKKVKRRFIHEARLSDIKTLDSIAAPIVIISVDDPEIPKIATQILKLAGPRQTVFHTSGSLSSSVLTELRKKGAETGSLHPLTSISDPFLGADQFRGTYFCVEGDEKAVRLGRKLVRSLGGSSFSVDAEQKALYHAAAVTAAGHVTALFDSAISMAEAAGLERGAAKKILHPLLKSAVANLATREPADALTGTFSRLDIQTFRRHLASFGQLPVSLVHLYLELGERSLELVQRREGTSELLNEFQETISVAKRKYRC